MQAFVCTRTVLCQLFSGNISCLCALKVFISCNSLMYPNGTHTYILQH